MEGVQDGFMERFYQILSALNAAQSRNKIRVSMQHSLILNGGSIYKLSHGFGQLLIGQLESRLEGEYIKIRV